MGKKKEENGLVPESLLAAKNRQINFEILEGSCKRLVEDLNGISSLKELLNVLDSLASYEVVPYSDVILGSKETANWSRKVDVKTGISTFTLYAKIEQVTEINRGQYNSRRQFVYEKKIANVDRHSKLAIVWYSRNTDRWEYELFNGKRKTGKQRY